MASMLTSKHSRQKSAQEIPNHLRRNTSSSYIVMILTYLYYWYFTIYFHHPLLFHIMLNHYAYETFFFQGKQFKLSGATQPLSSLEILIVRNKCSTALTLSLLPAILQLAVFHSVEDTSTLWFTGAAAIQSLSHTVSTYSQCRQEPSESEGPDWRVVWPPEHLCWHVGRCTNRSPKAKRATALLSVDTAGSHWPKQVSKPHWGYHSSSHKAGYSWEWFSL